MFSLGLLFFLFLSSMSALPSSSISLEKGPGNLYSLILWVNCSFNTSSTHRHAGFNGHWHTGIIDGSDNSCPPRPFAPANTHTHTHMPRTITDRPPPIRLLLSAAPCCRCFSGGQGCLFARRPPAADSPCRTTTPPTPSHLNLRRYQLTPRQLQPCLLKGTLPLEIMDGLWQIEGDSISQTWAQTGARPRADSC